MPSTVGVPLRDHHSEFGVVGVPFRDLRFAIGVAFVEGKLGKQPQARSTGFLDLVSEGRIVPHRDLCVRLVAHGPLCGEVDPFDAYVEGDHGGGAWPPQEPHRPCGCGRIDSRWVQDSQVSKIALRLLP
jgi:hypothetical protein